jgi:nicotinamide mononucleotide (NMN) deamidase PncC
MARGCLAATGADYAIATTGISGPTGATEDKPLGLVYVAVAKRIRNEELKVFEPLAIKLGEDRPLRPLGTSPNLGEELCEVVCNRYVFTTTRQQHQQRTANQALFDLYKLLTKNY